MRMRGERITPRNGRNGRNGHGLYGTPTYRCWCAMKRRCRNPNHISYPNYGGRGIRVCERWHQFDNFFADMGVKPNGTQIDRINNDGDYEPGNCRWVTPSENLRNRVRGEI